MLRSTVRLVAAVLLAVGLLCAPPAAPAKSKKADKASSRAATKGSKKDRTAKKDTKRDRKDRTAKKDKGKKDAKRDKKGSKRDRRSNDRVAKRGKKTQREAVSRASRRGKNADAEPTRARRAEPPPSQPANRAVASKRIVADFDENDDGTTDEAEEPPGPKPANRIVADIAPTRVVQIQTALVQKGLLIGPPNGVYDQPTFQAMAAFQSRNGWNPVGVPTADSLKALGVPKNSGRAFMSPARVVDATAPRQP